MTLQDKLYQATLYLQTILKIFAPKDTGNLSLNAIRVAQVSPSVYQIIIGGEIAPYAIYTNQKWTSPRWSGVKNPNEGWIERAIKSARPNLIAILSGKFEPSALEQLQLQASGQLQEQLDQLAEEV